MLSILIPYRSDSGRRDRIFNWVQERYYRLFPEAEIVIGLNNDHPFNRSAARNFAFRQSTGKVLVIADADVIPNRTALDEAYALVLSNERSWVLPYATYYNLDQATSDRILDQEPDCPYPSEDELRYDHKLPASVAGQLVMPRDAFEEVGGYDERYVGWGYEDSDFATALDTLWSPVTRLPGYCLHLWHEIGENSFENPMIHHNQNLHRHYDSYRGDPQRMREWIRGR